MSLLDIKTLDTSNEINIINDYITIKMDFSNLESKLLDYYDESTLNNIKENYTEYLNSNIKAYKEYSDKYKDYQQTLYEYNKYNKNNENILAENILAENNDKKIINYIDDKLKIINQTLTNENEKLNEKINILESKIKEFKIHFDYSKIISRSLVLKCFPAKFNYLTDPNSSFIFDGFDLKDIKGIIKQDNLNNNNNIEIYTLKKDIYEFIIKLILEDDLSILPSFKYILFEYHNYDSKNFDKFYEKVKKNLIKNNIKLYKFNSRCDYDFSLLCLDSREISNMIHDKHLEEIIL